MNTVFKKSFLKSVKQIRHQKLKDAISDIIAEVEKSEKIAEVSKCKKLRGYKQFYRIRLGDYRIGIQVEGDSVTFAAIDHRKDIYKHFP